jgi:hypothetical protein
VKDLPALLRETRRVLVPGGPSVHLVPGRAWRAWTLLAHYAFLVKRLLDTGISLQQIRVAVNQLREAGINDLAQITLMSDGASVYECTSNDEVIDLVSRGQGVFGIAVGKVLREVEHDLAPARVRDVHGDRELACVDADEVRALVGASVLELDVAAARVVALARALDLDDARAEVGEEARCPGAGEHPREVEDGEAGQGRVGHGG